MQDLVCELPRIPIPRTPVNRRSKLLHQALIALTACLAATILCQDVVG